MYEQHDFLVEVIINSSFRANCYIVIDTNTRQALLIDPGDEEDLILKRIRQLDVTIQEIICTHAHIDHAGAVAPLKQRLNVPFAVHPLEKEWLSNLPAQAMTFGMPVRESPTIDRSLEPRQMMQLGQLEAQILFTPGHSAGGCSIYFPNQRIVFVGDTLFAGTIGRTDLPGGSLPTLITSIREQLLTLSDEVKVYSGHGPSTTIGIERRNNPFLKPDGQNI